jgi:eukaryotic-like serine/threonine-protein kinase
MSEFPESQFHSAVANAPADDDLSATGLLTAALEDYLAKLEAGERPDRDRYVAQHPQIAAELGRCLDGLQFVHRVAPDLSDHGDSEAGYRLGGPLGEGQAALGDFRIIREIGRGGMGVVYEAEQLSLQRHVALKVLPFAAVLDPKHLQRFKNEALAAAQLNHPHIVDVYGVGCERGVHYYAMRLIEGETLADVVRQLQQFETSRCAATSGKSPPPDPEATQIYGLPTRLLAGTMGEDARAETPVAGMWSTERSVQSKAYFRCVAAIGRQVAEALDHAHQQGIVHRDVKPSNLMLDANGDAWITDFGLAHIETSASLTMTGDILGTLRYMSPEQALAKRIVIDHRTDVYSLGVTLYELLTLKPAFAGEDRRELLRKIAFDDPAAPRKLNHSVPAELETIVLKAVSKNPNDRYATAQELADDLGRFLKDEPIHAKRPTLMQRGRKWARRHRSVVTTGIAAALILAVMAVVGIAINSTQLAEQRDVAKKGWDEADRRRVTAEQSTRQAKRSLYEARLAQARAGRRSGRVGQRFESLKAIREAARLARELKLGESARMDLRNEAIACLALCDVQPLKTWEVQLHQWPAFDANSTHNATTDGDGNVSVRRVADDRELALLPIRERAYEMSRAHSFSPDGRLLATRSGSELLIWNWRTKTVVFRTRFADDPRRMTSFSPDATRVAVASAAGWVAVFDLNSGRELTRMRIGANPQQVAFSPHGRRLAISSYYDRQLQIRDAGTGKLQWKIDVASRALEVSWHPAGRLLAVSNNDFDIEVWDTKTGRVHAVLRGHQAAPQRLHFDDIGNVLCSWSWDGTVRLWNPDTGQERFRAFGIDGWLGADGRKLVSRVGHSFQLWKVTRGEVLRTLPFQRGALIDIHAVTISPGGRWLAVSGNREAVAGFGLYDLWRGQPPVFVPIRGTESVLFHPSGRALFVSDHSGVYRWPLQSDGRKLRIGPPTKLAGGRAGQLTIDPKGRYLAYPTWPGGAEVVDLRDSNSRPRFLPHRNCSCLAASPDARWIATATRQGRGVKVWEAATGRLVKSLASDVQANPVFFSPDGRRLITSTYNGPRIWDVGTWKLERQGHLQIGPIGWPRREIAWSRDGTLVAAAVSLYHVHLQDARSGKPLATFESPEGFQFRHLLFSPSAGQLVTASSRPPYVRVWDLRRLRHELKAMRLDWDEPPFPPAGNTAKPAGPIRVEVNLGYLPYQRRGRSLAAKKQWKQALAENARGIAVYGDAWELWDLRAQAHAALRDWDGYVRDFTRLIELRPHDRGAYLRDRAAAYARLGRWDLAIADREKYVELAPDDARAKNNLAWWLLTMPETRLRDPQRALELIEQAVKQAPKNANFWNTLGVAHYRSGNYSTAVAALNRSLELRGENSWDLFFLAMAHWQISHRSTNVAPPPSSADQPRLLYGKAVEWMQKHKPNDEELRRLRAETETLLKINRPSPTPGRTPVVAPKPKRN